MRDNEKCDQQTVVEPTIKLIIIFNTPACRLRYFLKYVLNCARDSNDPLSKYRAPERHISDENRIRDKVGSYQQQPSFVLFLL